MSASGTERTSRDVRCAVAIGGQSRRRSTGPKSTRMTRSGHQRPSTLASPMPDVAPKDNAV